MSDNSPRPSKRQRIAHKCKAPENKDGADRVTITCAYCFSLLEDTDLEGLDEYDARIEKLAASEKKVAELEKLLKEEQDKVAALEKLEREHRVALAKKEIEIEK